jgi:hypothetical protein
VRVESRVFQSPPKAKLQNVSGNIMTRQILLYIIIISFTISCADNIVVKTKKEFDKELRLGYETQYEQLKDNIKFRDNFLQNISDTVVREKWDTEISNAFYLKNYAKSKIKEISYLIMLQADTINSHQIDTMYPPNLKNFNESKNTYNLLNSGLNKIITQYLSEYDYELADTLYDNPVRLPKTINLKENASFWLTQSKDIKTLADFEICKVKLFRQMELSLNKKLKYYQEYYKKQ